MARVMLLPPSQGKDRVIFVNDFAVGRGCPNKRDDVMLIQFLLGWIGLGFTLPEASQYGYTVNGLPRLLTADGVCGPDTIGYIENFQKQGSLAYASDSSLRMVEDGIVSAVQKGVPWSTSGNALTIVRMNKFYVDRVGPYWAHSADQMWWMPWELKIALYMQ